ncbi:MAG: hypothetical protein REI94_08205 [Moraxellaceae bacterium]|nr:hypothetical protein [Moraxellaceae bacterium]
MKITESALQSAGSAMHYQRRQQRESLEIEVRLPEPAEQVRLSDAALTASESSAVGAADESGETMDPRLEMLIRIVEALTGRKVRFYGESPEDAAKAVDANVSGKADSPVPAERPTRPPAAEISVRYDYHEVREEAEIASYSARGQVTTADGRRIDFALDLEMARYEREETSISVEIGTPRKKDPLVLNLTSDRVRLEAGRFDFDLDADGETDSIARLGSGSAFLALDRNANGKVDDGKELFGALSGDGFADLAVLDDDGNGWIDEGDAAFGQLRLWRAGEQMVSLAEAGVGAIALDRRATPFTLKDSNGAVAGEVRTTGVFLNEDGSVGTVQQIDLVV